MDIQKFKIELSKINKDKSKISLYEGLKPNSYILEVNSSVWKSFYYDEKGNDSDIDLHKSESDALKSILNKFKEELHLLGKEKYH